MRRISLLLIIVSLGLCFSLNCNAQFKDEAFQQSYNNDKTAQKDTVDKLFSFKEYFGGLGHKNEMKVGTMFAGSAVFIGGSQIYNKQYWKLPIVYGGFLGCAYALTWNNQMYSDYSQAYLDIMDDDPATASFADFLPPNYNYTANAEYLKKVFKSRKDRYRRYRDLSIFSFIGVYLISVVDAYVDAELSHFDISEDLGMHVTPSVIDNSNYFTMHSQSVGLKCNITF